LKGIKFAIVLKPSGNQQRAPKAEQRSPHTERPYFVYRQPEVQVSYTGQADCLHSSFTGGKHLPNRNAAAIEIARSNIQSTASDFNSVYATAGRNEFPTTLSIRTTEVS
jgi:hypothetical protein